MDINGKDLKFNQLITKINIGKFTIFESTLIHTVMSPPKIKNF